VDEIRSERLLMRRFTLEDAPAMHRLMRNPEAMRFWSSLPHEDLEQTRAWVQSAVDAPPAGSDDFVMTLDGELIGKLGCWRLPEVGFMIDPAHWGRGYAREAMMAFIDRRRGLGSSELTADVDPDNVAALRLLTRCGFKETHREERTWNIGGTWRDSVYLRLDL
jgi:RimJ/RimL family protein N-acetyltransferase